MPARMVSVNLLGREEQSESPIGRIVTWATTYGRYIMISTEIVVLLAFLSRFTLDRKLTDLNEAIDQKRAIIEANAPFEKEVRTIQSQLAEISTLIADQIKPVNLLLLTKTLLPADVYFESLTITKNSLTAETVAGTTDGFAIFINNLQTIRQFAMIDISDIKRVPLKGIVFQFTARNPATAQPDSKASSPAASPGNSQGNL